LVAVRGGICQQSDIDVNESFTGILEINGYAIANDRLDLTQSPVRLGRMSDEVAGHQMCCHSVLPCAGLFGLNGRRCRLSVRAAADTGA